MQKLHEIEHNNTTYVVIEKREYEFLVDTARGYKEIIDDYFLNSKEKGSVSLEDTAKSSLEGAYL